MVAAASTATSQSATTSQNNHATTSLNVKSAATFPQSAGSAATATTLAASKNVLTQSAPATTYVTKSEFTTKLNELSDTFGRIISGSTYPAPASTPASGGISNQIVLTNRIDQLTNTSITNATVHGLNGLTDADIPDSIIASNYLPLSGGTLSGDLTLTGNFTLAGAQALSG
jgi:hypothetical protein